MLRDEPYDPGFALVRQLRDTGFRRYLERCGYVAGVQVLIGLPGEEPAATVVRLDAEPGQHFGATPDPAAPFGWRGERLAVDPQPKED